MSGFNAIKTLRLNRILGMKRADARGVMDGNKKKRVYPKHDSTHKVRQTTECCPTVDYEADQIELLKAMEKYQKDNNRKFPTYSEVLAVLISLGYRKVKPESNDEAK